MAVTKYADLNSLTRFKQNLEAEIPTTLASLSDDSTHRLVTDTEKTTWNGKENSSNKTTTITSSSTNNEYPSAKAVYDLVQSMITDALEASY